MKELFRISFPLIIAMVSCGGDRNRGRDIVEIDKTLSMWEMHQSRSCSALVGVIGENVESDVFDGGDHLNILRNQGKILSEILELNDSAAEENVRAWVKCQQEALDELLTQSSEKKTIKYTENPKKILEIQEKILNQILARRSNLINHERQK